jgi:predicted metalloprotease
MKWSPGKQSSEIEDRGDEGGGNFGGLHVGIGGAIMLVSAAALSGNPDNFK